jgi:hypothetical protein
MEPRDMIWLRNADYRNADNQNAELEPHDMPDSRMTCQTGAARQLEIGELESHDMMQLHNADCFNADYRNAN